MAYFTHPFYFSGRNCQLNFFELESNLVCAMATLGGRKVFILLVLNIILVQVKPFFLVYSYSLLLRHTTEEVLDACLEAIEPNRAALTSHLRNQVMDDLTRGLRKLSWFNGFDISDELPKKFSLEQWVKLAKESQATVFIAGQ